MPRHPNSLANLKPQRSGEPGHNPEGRNQYTYRQKALEKLDEKIVSDPEDAIEPVWSAHLKGKPWACKLVWDRALPVIQRHELEASISGTVALVREDEWVELTGGLDRIKSCGTELPAGKRNGNGAAGDPT